MWYVILYHTEKWIINSEPLIYCLLLVDVSSLSQPFLRRKCPILSVKQRLSQRVQWVRPLTLADYTIYMFCFTFSFSHEETISCVTTIPLLIESETRYKYLGEGDNLKKETFEIYFLMSDTNVLKHQRFRINT